MNKICAFLTVLAWFGLASSSLLIALRFIAFIDYTEPDKVVDRMRGGYRVYKFATQFIIFALCLAWIIAK